MRGVGQASSFSSINGSNMYRTTTLSSALLRRSLSELFLLRQDSPPGKMMNSWNNWRITSSEAPGSPASPSGNSVSSCESRSTISAGVESGNSHNRNENWQMIMVGSIAIHFKISAVAPHGVILRQLGPRSASNTTDKQKCYSCAHIHFNKRKYQIDSISEPIDVDDTATTSGSKNISRFPHESLTMSDCEREMEKYSLPTEFGKKRNLGWAVKPHSVQRDMNYIAATKKSSSSHGSHYNEPFDICLSRSRNSALEASLPKRNIENHNEADHTVEFTNPEHMVEFTNAIVLLRPGMVLLKHFVTLAEQIEIVKICRELGLGRGGFYQPGYKDGAKLRLQMMCLGLTWDPETRKYDYKRTIDGAQPPGIPPEFRSLVERAIQESHAHIKGELRVWNAEEILPSMSPNICIANFYTTSGRLGLHQDRDESKKSLEEGLPVVSISIGDSADFLYGDQREIGTAESVVLESGDVLIFGGCSRHIFHGVTSIIPNSAPVNLLQETSLRPGRLNLTLRQY